jgi:hypothetical protein
MTKLSRKRKMMLKQLKDRGMAGVAEKEEHEGRCSFEGEGIVTPPSIKPTLTCN